MGKHGKESRHGGGDDGRDISVVRQREGLMGLTERLVRVCNTAVKGQYLVLAINQTDLFGFHVNNIHIR